MAFRYVVTKVGICSEVQKNQWATEQDAATMALRASKSNKKPFEIYQCPHCKYWHLRKPKKSKKKQVKNGP